jgi:hypothetical protein
MNKEPKENYEDPWSKINSLDDVILKEEKEMIDELKSRIKNEKIILCNYLKIDGKYFYYCGACANLLKNQHPNVKENEGKISPFSTEYMSHIDLSFFQLFCMGNFDKCIDYKNYNNQKDRK